MTQDTGIERSRRESDDAAGRDPRFHAGFQRGYEGPADRAGTGGERFRETELSPRFDGRSEPSAAARARVAEAAPPRQGDEGSALSAEQTPSEPGAPESATEILPPPALPTRRISGALAAVGAAFVLLGVLALWNSSQGWFQYSPSQDSLGPEQYLRVASETAIGPLLTVGLVALVLAVVVPLFRAPR